jgi:hypothetical protein
MLALKRITDTQFGFIVAIAAAFLLNLPLWHGLLLTDEWSRPDIVIESSDEEFYITRIHEVADGHIWAGHPYMYERRDQHYPLGNFWEAVLGLPMRWFDFEIKTVMSIADAFFPLLLVLLLWRAVKPVLPEYRWRILLIGILFLGFEMHWWKRPISQQETVVLPLLWLWAALSPMRATMKLTIVRSLLIGFMTLSYPFHWTFCLAAEALLCIKHLMTEKNTASLIKRIAATTLPFIIAALPWTLMMLSIRGNTDYTETLERLGMLTRHLPSGLPLQAILVVAGAFTLLMRRKVSASDKAIPNVLLILLLTGLIVLNQPLITGKEAEFSSHYRQIIVFPLWIALLWNMRILLLRLRYLTPVLIACAFLFLIVRTAQSMSIQWKTYETNRLHTSQRESMNDMMERMQMIEGEAVVLTDDDIGRNLTLYTHHYPFFVYETHMYLTDNETIWNRFSVQQALFPEHEYVPRAVLGSSYLNKALHERSVCTLRSIIGLSDELCDIDPAAYLPDRWEEARANPPSQETIINTLKDAHVSYLLMKNIPPALSAVAEPIDTFDGYTLARLRF